MAEDMGESLVGAYLRYVEKCEFVLFNTFLQGEQGELDVIGIRFDDPQTVFFAEVTTHIGGMASGSGNRDMLGRVAKKLERAERFARLRFPDARHRFQVWSPRVPVGAMTTRFAQMAADFDSERGTLEFVINEVYGDAVARLVAVARKDSRPTSDPAYRLLQVLASVRTSTGPLAL